MDAARANATLPAAPRCGATTAGCSARGTRPVAARHLAVAEDYAALLGGLVTLAEVDDVAWLEDAALVAAELLRLFHDEQSGGFFTTGTDAEALIVRPQDFFDNATPSENSLAADGLLRLAALTGDVRLEAVTAAPARSAWPSSPARRAGSFAFLLSAYERATTPADRDRDRRRGSGAAPRGVRPADPRVGRGAGRARAPAALAHSPARRADARRRSPAPPTCASGSPAGCPSRHPRRSATRSTPPSPNATDATQLVSGWNRVALATMRRPETSRGGRCRG